VFRIFPLGDMHLAASACDEKRLRAIVKRIKKDKRCYWIGMGDYCDWINVQDKRWDAEVMADWIEVADLADLGTAQRERFMEIMSPIADRCLALVEGNHEITIKKRTERDVFSEIVAGMKDAAGLKTTDQLGVGVYGWLQLVFHRAKARERTTYININLHHGFVAGKLAGAKALNMQRWLWTHDCDICFMGHSHNTGIQPEGVETIDRAGNVRIETRRGAFTGTFLSTFNGGPATYSEERGYFPLPIGGVMAELRPGRENDAERIRLIYEG